jgi:uncharacterized membrane protein YphA (DoxX/SURF4 family)
VEIFFLLALIILAQIFVSRGFMKNKKFFFGGPIAYEKEY